MLVVSATVSALIGVAVANGRSALLRFTILVVLAYDPAHRGASVRGRCLGCVGVAALWAGRAATRR